MTAWLLEVVNALGYGGIFLLLVLARAVPPLPAETVIPLAGLAAAQGKLSLAAIALAGGLGSAVGELVWYAPSRLFGRERLVGFLHRHGQWLTVRPQQIDRVTAWFERYGSVMVLVCQPLPGLRSLVSIPAGACGLPVLRFLLYAAAGSCCWVFVLAGAGYLVEFGWPDLADDLGMFSLALLGLLLAVYLFRLVRQLSHRTR